MSGRSDKLQAMLVVTVVAAGACALALACETARAEPQSPSPSTSSPARWLSSTEKSEAWKQSTARCRALVEKLDPHAPLAPLVQRHLGAVQEKVQLLMRTPSFDWKRQTAIDYLENLLEDLLAGREPSLRYAGKGLGYPYWSNTMQRIEAIWVHVPPGYDPTKKHQLFMYYKCGGGIHFKDGKAAGGYRPTVEMANRTDTFHVWSSLSTQVKGRMGANIELEEATAALAKDFSIDLDRIFLTGWSDGGFTAIWLASHYPHLVAGIAPNCGNWQYTNVEVPGLSNVPTLAVDGWSDGGYNSLQFVRWLMLRSLGADASAIWGQHGHSYQPYEDPEEFQYLLAWAKTKRRDPAPKRVRYATWNLSWPRAYWVAIQRANEPCLACRIDAEVKGENRIEVQTWNVGAYKLRLSDKLVNPARDVVVLTNGRPSYSGPFKSELGIELGDAPAGKYIKSASTPDEIAAQTVESSYNTDGYLAIPGRTWLAIKPSGPEAKDAALLSKWYPKDARADNEVSDADLARQNLFLYGGPAVNRITARIAAELPVRFETARFIVGDKVYDRPTHCIALLHPNPLNPQKYVLLYAFNEAAAFAHHGFFGMTGESVWAFRTGDCVVRGIPGLRPKWGVATSNKTFEERHLIFDNAWRVPRPAPVGDLTEPFDYQQLLRLQADAVREATGADIGIIPAHTPSYLRWSERLSPGPVTLYDLATLDALPQYICMGQISGKDLTSPHGFRPAAWSVLDHRREPPADPGALAVSDLDPKKTYRVALGYHELPTYGAEPSRMPPLFKFATPEDFLADKHNSLFVHNLTLTPLQATEAVAQYLQKRGKVAPRPIVGNLVDYVMNPQVNDFAAYDWLHLGLDMDWRGPEAQGPQDRYTINLGFREARGPDLAPPLPNAKRFLDLDLGNREPARLDFASLGKRLPLDVRVKSSAWAITADREYRQFTLAPKDATGDKIGRARLLHLRITNRGPNELAGQAILADSVLRPVYGEDWPSEDRKETGGFYAGYHRTAGQGNDPPVHEDAALFLASGTVPKLEKLVTPNAGYNFGLVGLSHPVAVKSGHACSLHLLMITLDRQAQTPPFRLTTVLESLQKGLGQQATAEEE